MSRPMSDEDSCGCYVPRINGHRPACPYIRGLRGRIEELEARPKMMTDVTEVMEFTGWELDDLGLLWEHPRGMIGCQEVEDNLGLLGILPRKDITDG